MTKAQLEQLIVETLTNEKLSSLGKVKKDIQSTGACKWNVSDPGIKIFFDVTSVGSMIRPGSTDKSVFGVGISLVAMLTNKVLHSVNHVGFALSDGSIIHATTSKGVVRENGADVINNPKNYVIVNVGGNEGVLIDKFNSLKKQLYVDKDSYDWKGIVRQIPLIGKLLARLKWSENKPYRFFCSELVANLLVRCGVISYDELASIHEKQLTGLDKYDEVDPTKLFLLLKDKAELCPVVCDTNLNKENIMNQNELRQLVREAISELKEEANTKELQKLGFKPTKSDVNEGSDYDKMTPQQKHQYSILRDLSWEYDYTENGKVYMNRWDRGSDGFSKLATMVIEPDGNHYREKSVNESPIVRGLIRPDPKSPLEGAVVKRVEGHGHYHADMILLTKNNKEIKGRFEFDPHNPPSFYESVNEGRMKDIALDLKELGEEEFKNKYGKTKKEILKLLKSKHEYTIKEAGGYEDGIKDAKDRMKYVALRKMEKDHLAKSKITKDTKKQHHLDMANDYLDQAMAIAKKHGVVD